MKPKKGKTRPPPQKNFLKKIAQTKDQQIKKTILYKKIFFKNSQEGEKRRSFPQKVKVKQRQTVTTEKNKINNMKQVNRRPTKTNKKNEKT